MTRKKLTREERLENVRAASELLQNYTGHRDLLIQAAHEDGLTLRAIAEAAGLSHQRVHQIVRSGARTGTRH